MTNKEIMDLYEGLVELYDLKVELDIKIKYLLAKIKIQIEPLYEALMITRKDLFKKYGTENETSIVIKNSMLPLFSTEMNELMKIQVNVEIPKINLEDLNSPKISINLIEKLLPIIND